ncbi:MAG: TRAP transporter TatT component family protein [Xanthomonadales bacterium]|nr:TRAP transporter TatT component family protein [Xanthomonadales bacterium]
MKTYKTLFPLLVLSLLFLSACATVINQAGSGMAGNLNAAIMNQDDPEIVRDGAPAFLLMLDSFIEGSPNNALMLGAAAELYAAYGVLFVADEYRANRLTRRAFDYGQRSLCASNSTACNLKSLTYQQFEEKLSQLKDSDVPSLYSLGLSWIAYIKVHSEDWGALAKLPRVVSIFNRVQVLEPQYQAIKVEHFLAVLNTIRPPALGGNFPSGKKHFERAISLSEGKDLSIKVDFARFYARTLYQREIHDRLLKEVIAADPYQRGYTLFNILAQVEAQQLLDSSDDYF